MIPYECLFYVLQMSSRLQSMYGLNTLEYIGLCNVQSCYMQGVLSRIIYHFREYMDFINPLNIYGLLVEYCASWIKFICCIIRAVSIIYNNVAYKIHQNVLKLVYIQNDLLHVSAKHVGGHCVYKLFQYTWAYFVSTVTVYSVTWRRFC